LELERGGSDGRTGYGYAELGGPVAQFLAAAAFLHAFGSTPSYPGTCALPSHALRGLSDAIISVLEEKNYFLFALGEVGVNLILGLRRA
jgi:hypothetical protein